MRTVIHALLIAAAPLLSAAPVSATSGPYRGHGGPSGPTLPAAIKFDMAGTSRANTAERICRPGSLPPIIRLDGGSPGTCAEPPTNGWTKGPLGALDLFVIADGPEGGGRYWTITIGVAKKDRPRPTHHTCFTASTVGWRTLLNFNNRPLPWQGDLDNDGKVELILWDSFALIKDATNADFGLMAWVYRHTAENTFAIDWKLSQRMARRIANAYRAPVDSRNGFLRSNRIRAAHALDSFANRKCKPSSRVTR